MADNPNPNPAKEHGFGMLNDVSKPKIRKRFNLTGGQTMQAMAVATAEAYTPNALANVGQFKAIVLRVAENSSKLEPGSVLANVFSEDDPDAPSETPPTLVKIKARVPEIHSMLPIPEQLGSEVGPHQQIIDMYPTFVAATTAVEAPKVGDLVWVDWGNRQNWTDPVYIRPLLETKGGAAGGAGGDNGRDSHRKCAGKSYAAKQPSGDSIAASNASLKPFEGLPRHKRIPGPKGKPTFVWGEYVDPKSKAYWEKAAKELPPGKTWMGAIRSNGKADKKHKHGKRMTLVWHANTVDFTQAWELIYWFHGLNGFSRKNFEKRIIPQLKTMVEQGRNFVFVKPELPWSKRGTGKQRGARQKGAWQTSHPNWGGDFAEFHKEIMTQFANMPKASFTTIYGHSNGGSAIARAAVEGALKEVQPDRIFFSDSDYGWGFPNGGAVGATWAQYVKDKEHVWLTMMTIKDHTPRKLAKTLLAKLAVTGVDLKKRPIYHIEATKGHSWCGNNALLTVSEEHRARKLEEDKKKAAEAAAAPPNDDEGEENKAEDIAIAAAADERAGKKTTPSEPPKKDSSGENPPQQGPPSSPSENSKQSSTAKKPDWKTAAATPYQENRVKLSEYGASLVGAAADKLLVEVEPGVKLHKLVADRYKAFKAAAIKEGYRRFKISSGWRKHKWKSREHYEETVTKKYGSVANGKKWLAYQSPHETGMAMDVKAHGVYASRDGSKAVPEQKKTELFKWMKDNAHKFGFTPYKREPWHWECRLPYDSWASGEEFTKDFATKVTYIGGKHAQLPTGPSSGGSGQGDAGGGTQKCVSTNGGGSGGGGGGTPGPHTPGPPFTVSGGGGLGNNLVGGPDNPFGDPNKVNKLISLFVIHETAGHPKNKSGLQRSLGNRSKDLGVHFWGSCDGKIIQTCPVERRLPHANSTNTWSVGIEVAGFSVAKPDYGGPGGGKWKWRLERGLHQVSHKGKGDIAVEPGKKCASSGWGGNQSLPSPRQADSLWKLIVWLSKNPPKTQGTWRHGGKSGTPEIKIPIAFPCVTDDKFWWTKWNGAPTKSASSANNWFSKHRPAGIVSHARIKSHVDGICLEYYCYGRAKDRLSHKNAYYAMVGALCSGKSEGGLIWTKHPKHYVALGKQKFKAAWFNGKTRWWVGNSKWDALAKENPQWFA